MVRGNQDGLTTVATTGLVVGCGVSSRVSWGFGFKMEVVEDWLRTGNPCFGCIRQGAGKLEGNLL